MAKKTGASGKIVNRRAKFDYELGDDLITGIVLTGKETKALRMGNGHLKGAFVTVKNGELFLTNATITGGKTFTIPDTEQTASRKLLATKKQIALLLDAKEQGRTIVPLEFLTRGRYIKLRIAPGKGKKRFDKREVIKKRDQMRDVARATR